MMKNQKQRYTPAFKLKVVMELSMGMRTAGEIANEYNLSPTTLASWKKTFRERLPSLFEPENHSINKKPAVSETEIRLERKIDQLLRKFNQMESLLNTKIS